MRFAYKVLDIHMSELSYTSKDSPVTASEFNRETKYRTNNESKTSHS